MKQPAKSFALCVDNTDYKASLIPGKVYRIIPDPKAAKDDFVRIVDESGEDYLYHESRFTPFPFPKTKTPRHAVAFFPLRDLIICPTRPCTGT